MSDILKVVYLARNSDSDDICVWAGLDEESCDDEFWRGYTSDNHWWAWSKSDYRIVPKPEWDR